MSVSVLDCHTVMTAVQVVHRLDRDEREQVTLDLIRWSVDVQLRVPAAIRHFGEHLVDRVLVLAGPLCHILAKLVARLAKKCSCRRIARLAILRKEPPQVTVVEIRIV